MIITHTKTEEYKGKTIYAVPLKVVRDKLDEEHEATGAAREICSPCPLRRTRYCSSDKYFCDTARDSSFVWVDAATYTAWRLTS